MNFAMPPGIAAKGAPQHDVAGAGDIIALCTGIRARRQPEAGDRRRGRRQGELKVEQEALLVMTHAKSGSLSVVNARGKLVGVFTDGDFRRRMATDDNLLAQPLKQVMTHHPICIGESALAAEALKIFNERNIDDLIVVNAKQEPVGLVDSQDLPKLKIM